MTKRPHDTNARIPHPAEGAEDALLAPFFAAARAGGDDALPRGLQDRLLRDALALQPRRTAVPASRPGFAARLRGAWAAAGRLLGGAPGVAVVCSAGVAGVWIGLAVPDAGAWLDTVAGAAGLAESGDVWEQTAQDIRDDEALLAFLDGF